jgi:hypothetical protein
MQQQTGITKLIMAKMKILDSGSRVAINLIGNDATWPTKWAEYYIGPGPLYDWKSNAKGFTILPASHILVYVIRHC